MSSKTSIDKKTLEYLAELGRIELDEKNEEKLLEDLQKILGHFEELKGVDIENIEPMSGGTIEKNIFREDDSDADLRGLNADTRGRLIKAFPNERGGFLKVPAVFE